MTGPEETPTPPPTPPPAAPAQEPAEEEPTGGFRALAGLLALALAFAAVVLIAIAVDRADLPTSAECNRDPTVIPADGECFDGGSAQKSVTVAFLGLGGAFGIVGVLICLMVAGSGGSSRWMLPVTGAAILFGAIGVVVGNV